MKKRLNVEKAVQVAAAFLRFETGWKMSRLRLLKLLYIADRRALKETGMPIIGDRAVAMDCGPLHGTVYDLIKGQNIHEQQWSRYIRNSGPRDVHLHKDPGIGKLSRLEMQILQRVSEELLTCDDFEVVELTHGYAEYEKANSGRNRGSSVPIPVEDIIDGVQRSDDKAAILQDLADSEAFAEVFGE